MNQRTYWHLEHLKRRPSEYEIASQRLLYYTERGFETRAASAESLERTSELRAIDWNAFSDPRQTTYASYTAMQHAKESFVENLCRAAETSRHDERLDRAWIATLDRVIGPLRFPTHGLQMLAAYIAQGAPASPIVIAAAFETADQMRRVQRLAYRMRELQRIEPSFGAQSRAAWQTDPMWQPLRETIERLLVTWDWGEAFVATSFALRPRFDELFMRGFGQLARRHGDDLLEKVLLSLDEDCGWHRTWSASLMRIAIADRPQTVEVVRRQLATWDARAARAIDAFAPLFGEQFSEVATAIEARCREHRREAMLEP